jgi:hypothetical protein
MAIHVAETEVELTIVTRDEAHCAHICTTLDREGYPVERLG